MLVELTTDLANRRFYWPAGSQVDLPDEEAIRRIEAGEAIPVRKRPVETTSRSGPRRRGRPRKSSAS